MSDRITAAYVITLEAAIKQRDTRIAELEGQLERERKLRQCAEEDFGEASEECSKLEAKLSEWEPIMVATLRWWKCEDCASLMLGKALAELPHDFWPEGVE